MCRGENFKTFQARARGLKIRQPHFRRRRKRERAIEQCRADPQRVICLHRLNVRFPNTIPVLEGGFQVVFQKVDRPQKIVRIFIGRIDVQSPPHPGRCPPVVSLLESDPGELHRKAFVSGR